VYVSYLISSGLLCLVLLITFPALSHAQPAISSGQTSQELPAEAKDIRIIDESAQKSEITKSGRIELEWIIDLLNTPFDELGQEINVSTEDIKTRLSQGQPVHFAKDQDEENRTIEARWIKEALKRKKPIDIENAIIVGDLDLRVGEPVSINSVELNGVLEQERINRLKGLADDVYLVSSPISIGGSILTGKLLAGFEEERTDVVVFLGSSISAKQSSQVR
jgi:hypothetical protein